MRIAHIAPPWIAIPPKNYGGTENVLYNLIEEQVAQGHDVTLFAPGDARTSAHHVSFFPQSLIDAGIPWQAHMKAFYHLYKAVEYVKAHSFDVVHGHLSSSADMYIFPLMAEVATPFVVTLHSRFPFDRVQPWTGDADHHYMEWASRVPLIAISEHSRKGVPYKLNFIGVVHHGLPMSQFQPTVKVPEDYLVWLGRIVQEKGTHTAIQAAKQAGRRLILAGTIDHHLKESTDYFEEMVKPHIDGEQIIYVGPVNLQQKVDLLSRAYAMLNPINWEEPFGMVMIEAMAVGCPVITFPRGAAPEVVQHRKSGFLAHDFHEMVKFIERIPELDRSVVRGYVERNFSVRAMTENYTRMYKKVLMPSVAIRPVLTTNSKTPLIASSASIKRIDPVQVSYQASLLTQIALEPVQKTSFEVESGA
jgi:glycosyltransferase involved in cell wall biosynthesis